MLEKGPQECLVARDHAGGEVGVVDQLGKLARGEVGHWIGFEAPPDQFDRIEFRGIRRQQMNMQPLAPTLEEPLHRLAAVCVEPIPDQFEGPRSARSNRLRKDSRSGPSRLASGWSRK